MISTLIILVLSSLAQASTPTLIARFGTEDGWNAPGSMNCFFSEPLVMENAIYLGCMDAQGGQGLVQWGPDFKVTAVAGAGYHFSAPQAFKGNVTWREFHEWGSRRFFVKRNDQIEATIVPDFGGTVPTDGLALIGDARWVYRLKNSGEFELMLWDGTITQSLGPFSFAHVFPPIVGSEGELVFKTREGGTDESCADKLWSYDGKNLKVLFEDRDSNPASPWLSFRHQMSIQGDEVLLIARDKNGEALILLKAGSTKVIARTGDEVGSFDFFTPKLRNGVIAFRGEDSEGRKSLWKYSEGTLKLLLTAGDVVETDLGFARVLYPSKHSILYGSPGIGPGGEVVQQATLTKHDDPSQLVGIGLLKFSP